MSARSAAVTIGLGLYISLVLAQYGLHYLAFGGGGGPYPMWYSVGELVFDAARAVMPGLAVGWFCRVDALRVGAGVGAVGGLVGMVLLAALAGIPFAAFPGRMAVGAISTAITSAFTNAVGAAAGQFLRGRAKPTNALVQPSGSQER